MLECHEKKDTKYWLWSDDSAETFFLKTWFAFLDASHHFQNVLPNEKLNLAYH